MAEIIMVVDQTTFRNRHTNHQRSLGSGGGPLGAAAPRCARTLGRAPSYRLRMVGFSLGLDSSRGYDSFLFRAELGFSNFC